jgi:muconolactone delta-isomerase
MITADLPHTFTEEMLMLIPEQREYVNQLFSDGKLSLYSLNESRTKLWIVVLATDESVLADVLDQFPMKDYMEISYEPLLFHNTSANMLLSYGLN